MTQGTANHYQLHLQQQMADWPKHREAGKKGNPWATLCVHCYGRHAPPHGDICPYEPPSSNGESTEGSK